MESKSYAARLKDLRSAAGMSQAELATAAGLTKGGIANLEQGRRLPSWPVAIALADALGVSLDDFRGLPRKRGKK